jgi:GrpB-like predicted nucleotidyltransferase (UPF0157 family)
MAGERSLPDRLSAAGARAGVDPLVAWRALREREGLQATVLDLYTLAAATRGLPVDELPMDERHALGRAAMQEIWPDFALTEGSERPGDVISIVEYDPGWQQSYQRWHRALDACLGEVALRIEHVGSTSVPGLPAKPIIDIQVSVANLEDESGYAPALERAGLQLRSRDRLHRYFRPFPGQPRDVHVHVCAAGSDWEREHLLFRDYLRVAPTARTAYAAAKRQAAARWADDGIAYTDAKSDVITTILHAARDRPTPPVRP